MGHDHPTSCQEAASAALTKGSGLSKKQSKSGLTTPSTKSEIAHLHSQKEDPSSQKSRKDSKAFSSSSPPDQECKHSCNDTAASSTLSGWGMPTNFDPLTLPCIKRRSLAMMLLIKDLLLAFTMLLAHLPLTQVCQMPPMLPSLHRIITTTMTTSMRLMIL